MKAAVKNQKLDTEKIIKTARSQDLNVAQLGRKVGFADRNYMWTRLKGKTSMTVDEYVRLCDALNVQPSFFIKN